MPSNGRKQRPATQIDRLIENQLKELRLTPSALASDQIFLRRAYLDAIGKLPSVEETRRFLGDPSPDKRERLIDALLQREEFSDYWALKWSDLLRNEEKTLDRKGVRIFHQWIRDSIQQGKPLHHFAQEIVAGRGQTYQFPSANFYRAIREPYARAEAVAQVFLGIRIQCAKCHNHPFDRWTQDDYHDFAAFFALIDYRVLENNRRDRLDKHEFDGEQIVFTNRELSLKHPRSGNELRPRLLGTTVAIDETRADRQSQLAAWIGDPENPFFARSQANRIWFHLMGRGLVEPIDDFRDTNPASNAELLELLSRTFKSHNFDLRSLVRYIMTSRTYQRSSEPAATNGDDDIHFSRAIIQPLEAEQLLDALSEVIGAPVRFSGTPLGTRAMQLPAPLSPRRGEKAMMADQFLKVFGKPERLLTCECERSDDTGLRQAFQLINGPLLHEMLSANDNRIGKLLASQKTDREVIEELFLAALCRSPSDHEMAQLTAVIGKAADRRAVLEDLVWGLVNSKEFLLRR